MLNTTTLTLILLTYCSILSFGQEHQTVLSAPDNWKSEIIPFPLGFAQEIDFVGFEDLRFAPEWNDSSSQQFWTYAFVWYIDKGPAMNEKTLTEYFNLYYDGLMGVNESRNKNNADAKKLDKTLCLFIKTADGFSGKMRVYDRFFTKDYMMLNIEVRETFCSKTNKQIVRCDISPKDFGHEVWDKFDGVKLDVICE